MVRRYVKADVMREEGSPDFMPHLPRFVLATDYDALAAELKASIESEENCHRCHASTVERCDAAEARIRELEAERDSLQEDVIEVTTRMATAEGIIYAIDFRLGRDGWTLELAKGLGYSEPDRDANPS